MVVLRELTKYTKEALLERFDRSEQYLEEMLSAFQSQRIAVFANGEYAFHYVGVLCYAEQVVLCMPKYLTDIENPHHIAQIVKLLREYSRREDLDGDEIQTLGGWDFRQTNSRLSLTLFLLEDYLENNYYHRDITGFKATDGEEIDWERTIEQRLPALHDNTPFYLDTISRFRHMNVEDPCYKIHQWVIGDCYSYLRSTGLDEYIGFPSIIVEPPAAAPMPKEQMCLALSGALQTEYRDRQRLVLQALENYVSKRYIVSDGIPLDVFGTRSFHVVWEKVMGYLLDNQYSELKSRIAAPVWTSTSGAVYRTDTLIPDILREYRFTERKGFLIADAKYYSFKLEPSLSDYPGIGDITKQYLYQMAFRDYFAANDIADVFNVFLFPNEGQDILTCGYVAIPFLQSDANERIHLIYMPAQKCYQKYINQEKLNIVDILQAL